MNFKKINFKKIMGDSFKMVDNKKVATTTKKQEVKEKTVKKKAAKKTPVKVTISGNKKKSKPKKKNFGKKLLKILLIIFLSGLILALIGMISLFLYIKSIAPELDRSESTLIYDRNGNEIAKLGTEKREIISYEELPEVLIDAIVATEDARFFQHNGFDFPRFTSATIKQLMGNSDAGGASTITMQVVYNNLTTKNDNFIKDLERKFTDIYMSIFHIEEKYSKEEILEFYVNIPFLGNNAYGVEEASLTYFGKSAKDLNLSEAALIAGMFKAPSAYNPYKYPEKATERRSTVLYLMERHGYISNEERRLAESIPVESLIRSTPDEEQSFQGFIDTVVKEVTNKTGLNPYTSPMKIWTTMDPVKQTAIDKILSEETYKFENHLVQTGFSITNIHTGEIIAIGAGRDREGASNFNYATQINKQPGSTAKPLFDYAPAIEFNNWSTHHQILDDKISYTNGPAMGNWDGKFNGMISMRTALSISRNTPALRAFKSTKNSDILKMVKALGLNPEISGGHIHEAHSIGSYTGTNPLELGAAFGAFGNGGYYIEPYSVKKIEYRDSGEIYEHQEVKVRAMSEETAYMITDMLRTSVNEGLSSGAKIWGANIAAKTGTTNYDEKAFQAHNLPYGAINDLWTVGYSPDYAVSLWYGYDEINNQYINKISTGPTKDALYRKILEIAIPKDYKSFPKPNGVIEVEVEKETIPAKLPSANTPDDMKTKELFKKGTEPTEISTRYNTLPDIYNLNTVVSDDNKTIKLTWNYDIPEQLNTDILRSYFINNYGHSFAEKYLQQRLDYNNNTLGALRFGIYIKDENNNLTNIGYSGTNDYTYTIPKKTTINKEVTFVVKAEHSIINSMNSNGVEIKTTYKIDDEPVILIELNGEKTINLELNDTYIDLSTPISIYEDGILVTNGYTIKKEIKLNDKLVSSIDTTKASTYVISYIIKYGKTEKTLKRTVIIK